MNTTTDLPNVQKMTSVTCCCCSFLSNAWMSLWTASGRNNGLNNCIRNLQDVCECRIKALTFKAKNHSGQISFFFPMASNSLQSLHNNSAWYRWCTMLIVPCFILNTRCPRLKVPLGSAVNGKIVCVWYFAQFTCGRKILPQACGCEM